MSDSTGRAPSWLPWSVVLTATLLLVGSAAYVDSSLGQSALAPGMAEIVPSCLPLVVRAAVGGPCAADPFGRRAGARSSRCSGSLSRTRAFASASRYGEERDRSQIRHRRKT